MRLARLSSALILATGCLLEAPAAAALTPPKVVDLDRPGSLEALAQVNPDHYAKVERILADVARHPPEPVPRWMKAEFGADGVSFPSLLKTSDPPKRSLSFTLDETRYEAVITVPARWSFAR